MPDEIIEKISALLGELRETISMRNQQHIESILYNFSMNEFIIHLYNLDSIITDCFGIAMISSTAWKILLELLKSSIERRPVYVSDLCVLSSRTHTTTLRFLDNLEKEGLISRGPDAHDRRRIRVTLTDNATAAIKHAHSKITS